MPLKPGYTQYHGIVMLSLDAANFRRMERNIRRHIDSSYEMAADYWLNECNTFAQQREEYRHVFDRIRKDAAGRWLRTWGEPSRSFGWAGTPRQTA